MGAGLDKGFIFQQRRRNDLRPGFVVGRDLFVGGFDIIRIFNFGDGVLRISTCTQTLKTDARGAFLQMTLFFGHQVPESFSWKFGDLLILIVAEIFKFLEGPRLRSLRLSFRFFLGTVFYGFERGKSWVHIR